MIIPSDIDKLTTLAQETTEQCMISRGTRGAAYRMYGQWIETGRGSDGLSACNLLHAHIDRLAAHLFSPINLRFNINFLNRYKQEVLDQAEIAERPLNDQWRGGIDMVFGDGVKMSLGLGAGIMKQHVKTKLFKPENKQIFDSVTARSVFPWNFGVGNETETDLTKQEKTDEITYLTKEEVWRRLYMLPDRDKLYQRVTSSTAKDDGYGAPGSFMHQVLSTNTLDTTGSTVERPGGITQLTTLDNNVSMYPQVGQDLYVMHEQYLWDDDRGDWITLQYIEPDIIICPRLFSPSNLFCPGYLPYDLIQANRVANFMWGRSEIVDLMMPQQMLSTTFEDFQRVMGQQYDKLLVFTGNDSITAELYDQFRMNGYISTQGGEVKDVTPQLPQGALEYINLIQDTMSKVSGFEGVMAGLGQGSVRSGMQTEQLTKMGSPRLRDRSLAIERQCAAAATKTFAVMRAKDATARWVDPQDENRLTDFLLQQLPEDFRVSVDSHSSSPIYQDDMQNTIAFLFKSGAIDGEDVLEMLDLANTDLLVDKLRRRQKEKAAQVQQLAQTDPEAAAKVMQGKK